MFEEGAPDRKVAEDQRPFVHYRRCSFAVSAIDGTGPHQGTEDPAGTNLEGRAPRWREVRTPHDRQIGILGERLEDAREETRLHNDVVVE